MWKMQIDPDGRCKVCGCTHRRACVTASGPCYWVERELCSGCAGMWYQKHGMRMDPQTNAIAGQPFDMGMSFYQAFCLVGAIQLACRHPQFQGEAREEMEYLARQIQEILSKASGQWKFILEAGWDQAMDVGSDKGIIIIPP